MSDSALFGSQHDLQAESLLKQRAILLESELFERQVVGVWNLNDEAVVFAFAGQVGDALRIRTI